MEFEKGQKLWINLNGKAMFVEISAIAGTTIHFKDGFEPVQSPPKAEVQKVTGDCRWCRQRDELNPTGLIGLDLCNHCYRKYVHGI